MMKPQTAGTTEELVAGSGLCHGGREKRTARLEQPARTRHRIEGIVDGGVRKGMVSLALLLSSPNVAMRERMCAALLLLAGVREGTKRQQQRRRV